MLKRYEIDVEFYDGAYELENRESVDGEYCLAEDVFKVLEEYEHDFNYFQEDLIQFQEVIDELEAKLYEVESDRDMWKDNYNALYEQKIWYYFI